MKRCLILVLLFFIPAQMQAQTAVVQSGEHADFSRLVVQLEQLQDWEFGRVPGGYELRFDAKRENLDTSRVFTRIPRDRISDVTSVGPGRIFVKLACNCSGDAFEIRQGRLVVDIKDELPAQNSIFEVTLPGLENGLDWRSDNLPLADLSNILLLTEAAIAQLMEQELTSLNTKPDNSTTVAVADLETELLKIGNILPEDEIVILTEQSVNPKNLKATNGSLILPPWPVELPLPYSPMVTRKNDMEKQLLQQFSRAASQGLFSVSLPKISEQTAPAQLKVGDAPLQVIQSDNELEQLGVQNLRIQTAADRDAPNKPNRLPRTNDGYDCLPAASFLIADWAPEGNVSGFLSGLRSNLLKEFDIPDPELIQALSRRYLYLGFGAEAKQLLQSFAIEIPNADIYSQMASILDSDASWNEGRLASQISCETPAALWAVLAIPEIHEGTGIDKKSVLRYFSELPPHLRQLLGPELADRFLQADDLTTASAIRDIVDRVANNRDAAFSMMQAQIAAHDGDMQSAISQFKIAATSNGIQAPQALISLIEAKLDGKQQVSQKTALLAEAMASEYAGTNTGRQLARAAIKAFATIQPAIQTFEKIALARQNGYLNSEEARNFEIEIHLLNAEKSTDETFLKTIYRYPPMLTGDAPKSKAALREIAARLTNLGLPQKTIELYDFAGFRLEKRDKLLLAKAKLGLENPTDIDNLLADISTPEAKSLLALAREMQQDYVQAARYFGEAQMPEEQESANWRSGDFALLERDKSDPRYIFSQLASDLIIPSQPLSSKQFKTDNDISEQDPRRIAAGADEIPTIFASKGLIAQSLATRNAILNLLDIR